MPFRKEIKKALEALLSIQNEDGGIPATSPEKPSGCWTSASTLEAIFVSGVYTEIGISKIRKLVIFLLETQINNFENTQIANVEEKIGSWALFQGHEPSTMATGHSVAALYLASKFFDDDLSFQKKIENSYLAGLKWIEKYQNENGSWGTQPLSGVSGKEPSIIAILYALLPYKYFNYNIQNSKSVRNAIEYISRNQNPDGSWSKKIGMPGDSCNTARAVSCLMRFNCLDKNKIKDGLSFIIKNQLPDNGLWDIDTERYDIEKAPAQLIYNDNTNCDILVTFMEAKHYSQTSHSLFNWLLKSQQDNGLWYLCSPIKTVSEISTWSTAEWSIAIDLASRNLIANQYYSILPKKSYFRIILYFAIFYIFSITILLFRDKIFTSWNNLSEDIKTFIIFGVIFAIIIGVFINLFTDWLKGLFSKISKRIKNRKKSKSNK